MSRKFFTADFHLGFEQILEVEHRPFNDIQTHDEHLIEMCQQMTAAGDIIYHLGDLACFIPNSLRKYEIPVSKLISDIPAAFVNIRGNHDSNNRVKSLCESLQLHLTKKLPNVICGHYPSYDSRAASYVKDGHIVLCGHVHGKWKHCLDLDTSCLNINCGIDVWDYKLVSESDISKYVEYILKLPKEQVTKVKRNNEGKIEYV